MERGGEDERKRERSTRGVESENAEVWSAAVVAERPDKYCPDPVPLQA